MPVNRFARGLFGLLLALLFTVTSVPALAQEPTARIRFFHAIPGAPAVDIYTNGQLTITNLDFGQATTFVTVPAGDHDLVVTAAGQPTPLWQQTISPAANTALTLVASATTPPAFVIYQDDLNPLPVGKARFTAIHTIAGAPNVDIALTAGPVAIPDLAFSQPAGTLDLQTNVVYDFAVIPAGGTPAQALITPDPLALTTGVSYVMVVYGIAPSPNVALLAAPVNATDDSGFVRLAHGVSGAPAVDVYANGTLIAPALAFGVVTPHIALPAGEYNIALRAAGAADDLLTADITVETGAALTAAALGTPDDITISAFTDNIAGINAAQARISLINAIPGASVTAAFEDGTALVSDVAAAQAASASIAPTRGALTLAITADDGTTTTADIPAQTFYGGVYYNLFALSDSGSVRLITAPTGLAQGVASAPAASALVEVPALPPTVPPAEVPSVSAVPTAAPLVASALPTGRIVLNPGANLQLRELPNADARSLGLAPSGGTVTVNGRQEVLVPDPTVRPRANQPASFVEVGTLLDPKADLPAATTWLYVTYPTPDGGAIDAWVLASFLDIRTLEGSRLRLADLPLIASDQPGVARNTEVTPPPIPKDRVVVIITNLNPGVNVNIRRVPSVSGEVLARVPNDTVMEFISVDGPGEWVFVRYSPPEGGSITGWVNTLYVFFELNGKPVDYQGMFDAGLLVIADGTEIGEVTAGAVPNVVVPTVDALKDQIIAEVALNPGANMNLRRTPSPQSEVIAQIPSGTRLVVSERTADGRWLRVTFENLDGWIAAFTDTAVFVRLSQNGKPIDLGFIPQSQQFTAVTPSPDPQTAPAVTGTPLPKLKVIVDVVAMTVDPGGNSGGLPVLTRGRIVTLLYTDGLFSAIELDTGEQGWVPANALGPLED